LEKGRALPTLPSMGGTRWPKKQGNAEAAPLRHTAMDEATGVNKEELEAVFRAGSED